MTKRLRCKRCKKVWNTESDAWQVTCPRCGRKVDATIEAVH